MDKITKIAVAEIIEKYDPHTLIVYGSRARGDARDDSDVDIACFVDSPTVTEDLRYFNDIFLDVFIYSTKSMDNIEEFIKFDEVICVVDKRGLGKELLQEVKKKLKEGPCPLSSKERLNIIELRTKSLKSVKEDDIIGNYKKSWLQYSLLETYFLLRDMWYSGPKQSFKWLEENDEKAFGLFKTSYEELQNYDKLKELTLYVLDCEKSL